MHGMAQGRHDLRRVVEAVLCCLLLVVIGIYREQNSLLLVHDAPGMDSISAGTSTPPRLCSLEEIKHGAWHSITLPNAPYVPAVKAHSTCYSKESLTKANWSTYEWIPSAASSTADNSSCKWTKWDKSLFCKAFENQTIAILGDSLSWEHYSSLANTFGHRVGWQQEVWTNSKNKNLVKMACNDTVRLVGRKLGKMRPNATTHLINQHFPNVLVMNFGAHYVLDEQLVASVQQGIDEVRHWQDECRARQRKCQFVWRTTVPGHPNCRAYTKPAMSLAEMEALVQNRSLYPALGRKGHTFNWWEFQHQNQMVVSLLKESGIQFDILPAYEINMLRPDAHHGTFKKGVIDCMHSCEPSSKGAVYNQILLHLQVMQSQATKPA